MFKDECSPPSFGGRTGLTSRPFNKGACDNDRFCLQTFAVVVIRGFRGDMNLARRFFLGNCPCRVCCEKNGISIQSWPDMLIESKV